MTRSRIAWTAVAASASCAMVHVFFGTVPITSFIAIDRIFHGVLNIWIYAVLLLLTYDNNKESRA